MVSILFGFRDISCISTNMIGQMGVCNISPLDQVDRSDLTDLCRINPIVL